jgi:hypothetical protein
MAATTAALWPLGGSLRLSHAGFVPDKGMEPISLTDLRKWAFEHNTMAYLFDCQFRPESLCIFDKAKRRLANKQETGTWKLSDAKSLTLREHV